MTWFEEPVSSQDLAGLAAVRHQIRPDVAAGEYSWSLADSARLIAAGAVDCLQLDVTRCGGITEFLRGSALAAAHNLQVSGHCAPNLHARVGVAVPNLRHVEYFHDCPAKTRQNPPAQASNGASLVDRATSPDAALIAIGQHST